MILCSLAIARPVVGEWRAFDRSLYFLETQIHEKASRDGREMQG
jgi:hypothetical protein